MSGEIAAIMIAITIALFIAFCAVSLDAISDINKMIREIENEEEEHER